MNKNTTKSKADKKQQPRFHGLKNHPFVIPVLTFLGLFFVSLVLFIGMGGTTIGASDSRVVQLTIDGKQQTVPTRARTVQDFLSRAEIELSEDDIVEPSLDTEILDTNFSVNVYKARPVTVVDEGKSVTTYTAKPTPREVAEAAGLTVHPEDKVEQQAAVVDPENIIRDGIVAEKVVIDRATPASINLYGSPIPVRTHAATVADALKEKNIQTLPDDVITPSPETPLTPNTQVFIVRVGRQVETKEEVIAAPTETVQDPTLTAGTTQVRTAGTPGKKLVTYEVEMRNDKEASRRVLQEVVAVEPVKRVIVRGTKVVNSTVTGDKATILSAAGVPASHHYAADFIISKESGWRLTARNAGGCLGLGQACPGSKLIAACPAWETDVNCQVRFFTNYVNGRYGGWQGAYNFWTVNRWY